MKVYSDVQGHNFESTAVSVKRAGATTMQGAARESKTTRTERSARRAVQTLLLPAVLMGVVWSPRPIASSVRGKCCHSYSR